MNAVAIRIRWGLVIAAFLALPSVASGKKPVVAKKPSTLRTYRFTAKITDNGGITPFKVGGKITGEFTYDLFAKNVRPRLLEYPRYESKKNRMVVEYGSLRFKARGRIRLNIGASTSMEHFQIVTNDLAMPNGWQFILPESGRKNRYRTFGIVLQNSPTRWVLVSPRIPRTLKLSNFVNTRELTFDFAFGLRYPGGVIKRRCTLKATIETLALVTTQ